MPSQPVVLRDRRIDAHRIVGERQLLDERPGPRYAVMAGIAPHVHGVLRVAGRICLSCSFTEPSILSMPRAISFFGIVVRREVVRGERLAFLADVTVRATHTERTRETGHDRAQLRLVGVGRQLLQVLGLLGPAPLRGRRLARAGVCAGGVCAGGVCARGVCAREDRVRRTRREE
jgi:hypothetical protein